MSRPTLDETHLNMALVLSQRAPCTRRQVGALVIDKDGRIASSGYNGVPSGEVNCSDGGCPRGKLSYEVAPAFSEYSNCKAIHAEANALLRAGERAVGGTLVVTCEMCHECTRLAKAARLARMIWPDGEIIYEENN